MTKHERAIESAVDKLANAEKNLEQSTGCEKTKAKKQRMVENCRTAVEALLEMRERNKGCEICNDDSILLLNWKYGLDHVLPNYKYCPMCGKDLEKENNNE